MTVGVIDFDSNYEGTNNVLKVVIKHFYKNCCSDDFLRYIDKNKMLFILFNCNIKNIPRVINRSFGMNMILCIVMKVLVMTVVWSYNRINLIPIFILK
ncbi:MAG: hypothetical protein ACR5KW_03665 [Wolbachia sp.]